MERLNDYRREWMDLEVGRISNAIQNLKMLGETRDSSLTTILNAYMTTIYSLLQATKISRDIKALKGQLAKMPDNNMSFQSITDMLSAFEVWRHEVGKIVEEL